MLKVFFKKTLEGPICPSGKLEREKNNCDDLKYATHLRSSIDIGFIQIEDKSKMKNKRVSHRPYI